LNPKFLFFLVHLEKSVPVTKLFVFKPVHVRSFISGSKILVCH
jgi:hypothetical protein